MIPHIAAPTTTLAIRQTDLSLTLQTFPRPGEQAAFSAGFSGGAPPGSRQVERNGPMVESGQTISPGVRLRSFYANREYCVRDRANKDRNRS